MNRPGVAHAVGVVLGATTGVTAVSAQGYPDRPIRYIVPFAAGGGQDIVARQIAPRLGERLGQPPHLTGDHFLRHNGIAPGSALAYALSCVDFTAAARRYGKLGGYAHLATLVRRLRAQAPTCTSTHLHARARARMHIRVPCRSHAP